MIKHSPAENFLKYLIAHPSCYDNTYIQDVARELSLDLLGDWYLSWLRDRVRPPSPFYPEHVSHKPSVQFMVREQLTFAFQPDEHMQQAQRILGRARLREAAESMILSGAPSDAVVAALQKRFQYRGQVQSIARYKHYYWNIEKLDSTEMRALLDMRHTHVLESPSKEVQAQYASLHRARYSDARTVASKLAHTPVMGLIAQVSTGIMPKKVDVAAIVQAALNQSLLKVVELTGGATSPQAANMSAQYAMVAESMQRLKDTVANPEDALREDLNRIGIAVTPHKVPTVKQLSGGNHTTNLQPEPKTVEAEFIDDDS